LHLLAKICADFDAGRLHHPACTLITFLFLENRLLTFYLISAADAIFQPIGFSLATD